MKLSVLKKDLKTEGVWHKLSLGFEVKICDPDLPECQSFMRKAYWKKRKANRNREPSPEEAERIVKEAWSRFVLVDWRGVEDEDGAPLQHSQAFALKLFMDPEWVKLWELVQELALGQHRTWADMLEDAAGNSEGVQSGTPDTGPESTA